MCVSQLSVKSRRLFAGHSHAEEDENSSANLSGAEPARTVEELDPALLADVAGTVDAGSTAGGVPSSVVAWRRGGLAILRAGAISEDAVREALALP